MNTAGIDLSTKKVAVVALVGDGGVIVRELVGTGRRAPDRFTNLVPQVNALALELLAHAVELVFVEDISFVRQRRTELDLAKVQGMVEGALRGKGLDVMTFNNQTIKAAFNLTRSPKGDVVRFIERTFDLEHPSEDVADAALVLLYGRQLLGL